MQAHAGADARGHLHRAGAFQFLDIDHAQARGHGQMHGFAGFVAQRAQGVARGRTQARAAPAAAGQLHQAMAQRPAAGRADLHQQPLGSQRRHDPVHGGTRKAGGLGDLGDAHGLGIVRHPLQHAHELGKRGGASDAIVGGVGSGSGRGGRHARNLYPAAAAARIKKAGGKAGQHNPPLTPARPCCLSRLKTTLGHHVSPSTGSTTPVMKAAAGVHRNTAARATSSGVPQRASGVRAEWARRGPGRPAAPGSAAWRSSRAPPR